MDPRDKLIEEVKRALTKSEDWTALKAIMIVRDALKEYENNSESNAKWNTRGCSGDEETKNDMVQVTLQKRICAGVGCSPEDVEIFKNIMMPMYPQTGWDIEGETIEKVCFEDGRLWFLVEDDCHFECMRDMFNVLDKEIMDAHVDKYLKRGWGVEHE